MSQEASQEVSVKVTVGAGYISNVFEALSKVRDEGKIRFTDERIYSRITGPSDAIMAICRVKGKALNGINVDGAESIEIASDLEELYEASNIFNSTTDIQINYPIEIAGSRGVEFNAPDEGIRDTETVLDPATVADIPDTGTISHKRQVIVDGSDFKQAITKAERKISDSNNAVKFGTEDDMFYIKVDDKIDGSFEKMFYQSGPSPEEDLGDVSTEIGYPLIDSIKKIIGGAESVTVHVADSQPVRLDLDLDEAGDAQIIYIIAPRINS